MEKLSSRSSFEETGYTTMSGCGRKHRAKHLTREYLDDDAWCGPVSGEDVAVAMQSPSSRQLRVTKLRLPPGVDPSDAAYDGTGVLVSDPCIVDLPGKFSKVIWIGVNDVVVVVGGTLDRKPSPAQLEKFYAAFPAWKAAMLAVTGSCGAVSATAQHTPVAVSSEEHADVDALLENPNRNSIKHRQAYFEDEESADEEEEVCDEEEEEANESDE